MVAFPCFRYRFYYSNQLSEQFSVEDACVGRAYISKYEGTYHRVFIKAMDISTYESMCVDVGLTEKVKRSEAQCKYLLNYFAEPPAMAIVCNLADIELKFTNYCVPPALHPELKSLYAKDDCFLLNDVVRTSMEIYVSKCFMKWTLFE